MARIRSTFGGLREEVEAEGSDAMPAFILVGQRGQEPLKLAEISFRSNQKKQNIIVKHGEV
jgi:hypothetical protein